jgi:hypothetical protein
LIEALPNPEPLTFERDVLAFAAVVEYFSHGGTDTHTDCPCACLLNGRMEALFASFPAGAVAFAMLPEADRDYAAASQEVVAIVRAFERTR